MQRIIRYCRRLWVLSLLAAGTALAADTAPTARKEEPKGDAYPLDACIVSGGKLGSMGDPYLYDHDGREIRFCCGGCVATFKADADSYLKKIDEQITKQQLPFYPLETCVVSGEKLGEEEAGAVNHIYKNRLVRFCCPKCVSEFGKDPAAYLKKIDQAVIAKQKAAYPLTTCVVSGEDLQSMGGGVDYVHGNRLVRFCCKGCVEKFRKHPNQYMATLNEKLKEKAPQTESSQSEPSVGKHEQPAEKPEAESGHQHGATHAGSEHKH